MGPVCTARPSRRTVMYLRDLNNLFEPMGDVDDCGPRPAQSLDHFEKHGHFVLSTRRSRFVHHQNLHVSRKGLQHFDNLASARWKVLHFLIGIHIEAMSIGQGTGVCEHSIFAVGAEQPAARLYPEPHVLGNGEIRGEAETPGRSSQPRPRGSRKDASTPRVSPSRTMFPVSGRRTPERIFIKVDLPRAVFAYQGVNRPLQDA